MLFKLGAVFLAYYVYVEGWEAGQGPVGLFAFGVVAYWPFRGQWGRRR